MLPIYQSTSSNFYNKAGYYKKLAKQRRFMDNTHLSVTRWINYGCHVGPLATIRCKPRQARKGATVAADSCAGMRLAWYPPNQYPLLIESQ